MFAGQGDLGIAVVDDAGRFFGVVVVPPEGFPEGLGDAGDMVGGLVVEFRYDTKDAIFVMVEAVEA